LEQYRKIDGQIGAYAIRPYDVGYFRDGGSMKKYQVGKARPCSGGIKFLSLKEVLLWKAF